MRGLGAALLKHFIMKSIEVAELIGVRVVLVHAKDSATAADVSWSSGLTGTSQCRR